MARTDGAGIVRTFIGRGLPALAVLGAVGLGGLYLVQAERSRAERAIYQERLAELTERYASLRDHYNAAVRRTAVTELLVDGASLAVRVRTADGVIRQIETPYDPAREVYVDYAVIDSRVWIRRVFDEDTAPSEATVIDPRFEEVDWDLEGARLGKAVYRSLSDGRWVISVSGNGSLGLTRLADDASEPELIEAPAHVEFAELEAEIQAELDKISSGELLSRVFGG